MTARTALCTGLALTIAAAAAALTPCTTLVVPAAARGPGSGTSVWQMDLLLINPGSRSARVDLYWLERDADNRSATPVGVTVPAGQVLVLPDVIWERFGLESAAGAIRIESDVPVAATSRIYNLQSGVTFGQGFEGLSTADAITACCETVVGGLRQDSSSRSNLFAVAGEAGASFRVDARTPAGAALGSVSSSAPPWGAVYIPLASVVGPSAGPFLVSVTVDSGHAWFAGSRIDEGSGDPVTLAAVVPDPSLVDLTELSGSYVGIWEMEGVDLGGVATMSVAVAASQGTAAIILDFDGPMLNGVDPGPATMAGPLGPGSGAFYGISPELGSIGAELDAHGHISWIAAGGSDPEILSIEAAGVITPTSTLMVLKITLAGGLGTRRGVISLERIG